MRGSYAVVVESAVGEVEGWRYENQTGERVVCWVVEVVFFAIGPLDGSDLVGQAGCEIVDEAVMFLVAILMIPGYDLEGEVGSHLRPDVAAPRTLRHCLVVVEMVVHVMESLDSLSMTVR